MATDEGLTIKPRFFWMITILILLLPLSTKYRLIFFGERSVGRVIDYREVQSALFALSGAEHDRYPIVEYTVNGKLYRLLGPENASYDKGDTITVAYRKGEPTRAVLLKFDALYLGRSAILPGILLVLWVAFYRAFRKPPKSGGKSGTSASRMSPPNRIIYTP